MNNTAITSITASEWILPLQAPFRVATRTAYEARNVLVSVCDDLQTIGFGAAAPVAYVTGESIDSVIGAIRGVADAFIGADPMRAGPLLDLAGSLLAHAPSARAALEMAILDLWGRSHRINLWHYFGARRDCLTTDLTIPIVEPTDAAQIATQSVADGFTLFKVKVGGDISEDLARIRAVASVAPQASIRIDANQAFTPEDAIRFAGKLLEVSPHIELIEQPVAKEDIAGLKYVHEHVAIPIFADECAQTPASVWRLIREEAVDGVNVKLMKSGIVGALEIISICRTAGIQLMIGCMLESRLGTTAAAYIAAGTGAITVVDLDAHCLLAPDEARSGGFKGDGPTIEINSIDYGWGVRGL